MMHRNANTAWWCVASALVVTFVSGCGAETEVWSSGEMTVEAQPGSSHCSMDSLLFLEWRGSVYVRDPENIVPSDVVDQPFDIDAHIPEDASDTGLRQDDRQMWQVPDGHAVFVVDGDSAERWPQLTAAYGCD